MRTVRLAWIPALAGVLAYGAAVQADPAKPPPKPLFLSDSEVAAAERLPPPPSEGSPAERRELAELHRLEAARTPRSWARAQWDDSHEDGAIFAPVIGAGRDLSRLPATARLLADVRHEEKIAGKRAKNHFKRKRPWIVDPSLTTCSREDGPLTSYPSGHTVMAYSMAAVLSQVLPARRAAIMAKAADYAHERLVCAMHYRSDIVAGRVLGLAVGRELLAKPAFQAEARAARQELRARS